MEHVFKDYLDPDPQRRYKMVLDYYDFRGRGITFAFSPDGVHWEQMKYNVLHGGNPVLESLHGMPLVMKIYLRNATVYSMKFNRMGDPSDPVEQRIHEYEAAFKAAEDPEESASVLRSLQGYMDGIGTGT